MVITNNDLLLLNKTIFDISNQRSNGVKARHDIKLENGQVVSVYHLGQNNKTIRLDLKL